jgi:hypothetical protein
MPQIFHPSMNTIARVSIFGAVFIVSAALALLMVVVRSPYTTEAGVVREQPVPFSHKHHVGDVGLDCRYCHASVETSSFAGMPSTEVCMNCHSQLFRDSPLLQPVRESWKTDQPLAWTRVHDLPDFAYFDHGIHVHKGIACATCHGPVNEMPLMWREHSLHMEWCLACHRDPQKFVGPRAAVFSMNEQRKDLSSDERSALADEYHIRSQTNCSVCHR